MKTSVLLAVVVFAMSLLMSAQTAKADTYVSFGVGFGRPSYHPTVIYRTVYPTYTPTYYPTYTPTYYPTYVPRDYPVYTPTYYPTYTPIYPPIYRPVYTPIYRPVYRPVYTPSCPPVHRTYTPSWPSSHRPEPARTHGFDWGRHDRDSGRGRH